MISKKDFEVALKIYNLFKKEKVDYLLLGFSFYGGEIHIIVKTEDKLKK